MERAHRPLCDGKLVVDWWWNALIDTMQIEQGIYAGMELVIIVDNVGSGSR